MEIVLSISKKEDLLLDSDYYIVGLKDYSDLFAMELNEFKDYEREKIFLAINNNLTSKDADNLLEILKDIDTYNFKGIFFYDLGLISIKEKLGFKTPLILNQTHLVTNYQIINFYVPKYASGAVLTPELSFEEIEEIINKTNAPLFIYLYAKNTLALSKRRLLSTYFGSDALNYIKVKNNDEEIIVKEAKETKVYYNKVFNGTRLLNLDFNYGIIDAAFMDEALVKDLLKALRSKDIDKLNTLAGPYHGFLDERLITRVKK